MREFVGSVFRFGWAMGMLGVDQAVNVLDRERGWRRSSDSLDAVAAVAQEHLGPTARRVFETGDRLQSGFVETASHLTRGLAGEGLGGVEGARRRFGATLDELRVELGQSRPAEDPDPK